MDIPGLSQLLVDIKALEDYARACRREEVRMMVITREEVEVIESYRRFLAEE